MSLDIMTTRTILEARMNVKQKAKAKETSNKGRTRSTSTGVEEVNTAYKTLVTSSKPVELTAREGDVRMWFTIVTG